MNADTEAAPLFVGAVTEAWPAYVHLRWSVALLWFIDCEICGRQEHAGAGLQTRADNAVIRRARALAVAHRACTPREVR